MRKINLNLGYIYTYTVSSWAYHQKIPTPWLLLDLGPFDLKGVFFLKDTINNMQIVGNLMYTFSQKKNNNLCTCMIQNVFRIWFVLWIYVNYASQINVGIYKPVLDVSGARALCLYALFLCFFSTKEKRILS